MKIKVTDDRAEYVVADQVESGEINGKFCIDEDGDVYLVTENALYRFPTPGGFGGGYVPSDGLADYLERNGLEVLPPSARIEFNIEEGD